MSAKPSTLMRTLSKKMGKKKEDGTEDDGVGSEPVEKPASLGRTLSQKFSRKSEVETSVEKEQQHEEETKKKPSLARTLSTKFGKMKDTTTGGEDSKKNAEEKPAVLARTLSSKFGKMKDTAVGEGTFKKASDDEGQRPASLGRTLSMKFGKMKDTSEEAERKKKLRTEFHILVRNVSKSPVNNTTVFLNWKRGTSMSGDTKRALVTDHRAHWNETIVFETILLADGDDTFKPAVLLFELKEDKLVRKAGKTKWNVLGKGQFDLADYAKASKQLVIIPLSKKKANMQLELEVTSDWIKYDGRKFEKVVETLSRPVSFAPGVTDSPSGGRKRVEAVGATKYVVSTDTEQSDVEYTEEEVDLNLSDETDDDDNPNFRSKFAQSNNPFDAPSPTAKSARSDFNPPSTGASSTSFTALLGSLAGAVTVPPSASQEPSIIDLDAKGSKIISGDVKKFKVEEEVEREKAIKQEEQKEADRRAKEAMERKAQDEAKRQEEEKKNQAQRKAKEDSRKREEEEEEERRNQAAERKIQEEAKKKRLDQEEEERKKKEEQAVERRRLEQEEQKKKEEQRLEAELKERARKQTEQEERLRKEEADRKMTEERKARIQAARTASAGVVDPPQQQGPGPSMDESAVKELRDTISRQRREIDQLRENEKRFQNTLNIAEKKVAAYEAQMITKERELKRALLLSERQDFTGDVSGDSSSSRAGALEMECAELTRQVLELEAEVMAERRRFEMSVVVEKHVFLGQFAFNSEQVSISALKIFDDCVRLHVFDSNKQNTLLLDQLLQSITLFCQLPTATCDMISYWISSGFQLLQLVRNARKRLGEGAEKKGPIEDFEGHLCKLVVTLYTRQFTAILRRIEQLLVESLGAPYERENYFNLERLAMGRIIIEFAGLWKAFEKNHWPPFLVNHFFLLCVELINRFLVNRILLTSQYCTFNNGVRIKMELSFLTQWMMQEPHGKILAPLVLHLDPILEAAQLLTMSKNRGSVDAFAQFRALNARQIYAILQQYKGMDSSSRSNEKKKDPSDLGDAVDPFVLTHLESTHPKLHAFELPVADSLSSNLVQVERFLQEDSEKR